MSQISSFSPPAASPGPRRPAASSAAHQARLAILQGNPLNLALSGTDNPCLSADLSALIGANRTLPQGCDFMISPDVVASCIDAMISLVGTDVRLSTFLSGNRNEDGSCHRVLAGGCADDSISAAYLSPPTCPVWQGVGVDRGLCAPSTASPGSRSATGTIWTRRPATSTPTAAASSLGILRTWRGAAGWCLP